MNRTIHQSLWALLLFLGLGLRGQAQVITWTPTFPTLDDSLIITFNAAEGNGGLAGFTGAVYIHCGLVTAGPNSVAWTRVPGTFSDTDPKKLTTSLGNNLFRIGFVPRKMFGNVPANVTAYRIGMLFRDAAGNRVGRSSVGGDIFMPLYQPGELAMRLVTPFDKVTMIQQGDIVPVHAEASQPGPLVIEMNGTSVASNNGTSVDFQFSGSNPGAFKIRAGISGIAGVDYYDSVTVVVRGTPRREDAPTGWKLGPNYLSPTSVGLLLAAPQKGYGYVLGDFNDWQFDTASFMRRTPDGNYLWARIDNLTPGQEYGYQFFVDGNIRAADPLSELVLDPNNDGTINALIFPNRKPYPTNKTTGIVSVMRPGRQPYAWRHTRPTPPAKTKMVVYELHLRDFLGRPQDKGFQGLIDTLNYLTRLGVNAIELMPINEFEGNNSWGYNPSFHGAVDKAYGPPEVFKALVDSCHGRGILVILDVVYNHAFGQSPLVQMWPAANSPYVNTVARHPYNVGTDLNHESAFTRAYVNRCNERWLEEFQVDGFRFDLSKGLTQKNTGNDVNAWGQYDATRIANLNVYRQAIQAAYAQAVIILEHFAVTQEEKELTEAGFFTWGNMTGSFRETAKGNAGANDFNGAYYTRRGLTVPNAVIYMESHDEQRIVYDVVTAGRVASGYNLRDSINAYDRAKQAAVFFFGIPGPKMIWEFGELGYPYSINQCPNGTVGTGDNCRTDPKPVRWSYVRNPYRQSIYKVYQSMIKLVQTVPAFATPSAPPTMTLSGTIRRINLTHADGDVNILGNFNVISQTFNANMAVGKWYEFFTRDSITIAGAADQITLRAGEYRIYSRAKLFDPGPGLTTSAEDELPTFPASLAYPNPTTGKLTVETGIQARLEDMQGRLIQIGQPANGQAHLDLSALKPGLYLVRTGTRVQRVVKQ